MLFWTLSLAHAADPVDHAPWQAVLDQHLAHDRVSYAALGGTALDPYLEQLATADLTGHTDAEVMAFWINAYNALTVDLVAENAGIATIMSLDEGKVWDTRTFTVAGQTLSLNGIEHTVLRPMGDPRVHAALNCASVGCPPLSPTAFTGADLYDQMDAAAHKWVATNAVTITPRGVQLNSIFDWYGDDFVGKTPGEIPGVDGKQEAALLFVATYATPDIAAILRAGGYQVGWQKYDWALNKR